MFAPVLADRMTVDLTFKERFQVGATILGTAGLVRLGGQKDSALYKIPEESTRACCCWHLIKGGMNRVTAMAAAGEARHIYRGFEKILSY